MIYVLFAYVLCSHRKPFTLPGKKYALNIISFNTFTFGFYIFKMNQRDDENFSLVSNREVIKLKMKTGDTFASPPETTLNSKEIRGKFRQFLATVCLGAISLGASLAWTSPVLPQLMKHNTTLSSNASLDETLNSSATNDSWDLSVEEGSWVGSLMSIGALTAALPAGYLADRFGHKKCTIGLVVPVLIFAVLTILAQDVYALCIARFISGLATGGVAVVAPMYISEISDVSLRGTLGSFFELLIYVGIVFTAICGAYLHYVVLTAILGVLALVLAIIFLFLPESPTYLMKINQKINAEKSLRFYRSKTYNVTEDLNQLEEANRRKSQRTGSVRDGLKSKAAIRGLIASVGLTSFQQTSGIDGITFYTVQIFQQADTFLDAYTSSIIVAAVELLSAIIMVFIVEKADRKVFLYISSIGTCVCLAALALYFHLKLIGLEFPGMDALPLVSLIVYIFAFAFGLGPVPWMINGELFAPEIKGLANGITITTNWSLLFVVTKTLPVMLETIGPHVTFYIFAGFMVVCTVFVKFCVPETRGKTLQEIQDELNA